MAAVSFCLLLIGCSTRTEVEKQLAPTETSSQNKQTVESKVPATVANKEPDPELSNAQQSASADELQTAEALELKKKAPERYEAILKMNKSEMNQRLLQIGMAEGFLGSAVEDMTGKEKEETEQLLALGNLEAALIEQVMKAADKDK